MLNIRALTRPQRAVDYYLRESEARGAGVWLGKGCSLIGVTPGQKVTRRDFALALDGYAVDGRSLINVVPAKRRCAYDVVISATKSVSIAAVRGEVSLAKRILAIVEKLVRRLVTWLESLARSRGTVKRGTSLAAACFVHQQSRVGDEHVHAHVVTMNLTRNPESGELRAIELRDCFKHHLAIERRFQQELRRRLSRHGIAAHLDADGRAVLPISAAECVKRSRMRTKIDRIAARFPLRGKNRFKLREIVGDRLAQRAKTERKNPELIVRWADVVKQGRIERPRRRVARRRSRTTNPWKAALDRLREDKRSAIGDLWVRERRSAIGQRRHRWLSLRSRLGAQSGIALWGPSIRGIAQRNASKAMKSVRRQRMRKELQREIKVPTRKPT